MTEHDTPAGARTVVGNRYEVDLDHPLGKGGMAIVYRGRDLRSRREVAIKTLRPEYQRNPESRRRFRQEARMMAFVSHPRLVTIYDLHEEASGSWVVMELVPGRNLKQIVEEDGPLTPIEIMPILNEVADALGHLHERNLVHLDIKPQNIVVMPNGHIKLIDFGLAQPAGPSQQMVGGTAFGTAAYLSPEQASGEAVDAATDVYALGCVVYELLTGRPPFIADQGPDQKHELIRAHLEVLPVAPSEARPDLDIPSWVDDVVGWALAKPKHERFHDAATFARMFLAGLEGEPLPESHPTTVIARRRQDEAGRVRPARSAAGGGPAVVVPAHGWEDEPPQQTRQRTMWDAIYAYGGRAAQRSGRLRYLLWRLTLVLLIGNLLLGTVLLVRGGPSALVERFLAVAPNTTTEVTVDELNVRAGPSVDAPIIGVLVRGQSVRVTGLSETTGDNQYWPVEVTLDGQHVSGWVWDGGLAPNMWTGRLSWVQGVVERVHGVGRAINGWSSAIGDLLESLWPFSVDTRLLRHSFAITIDGFVIIQE
ncbi:MAG: protein kinase [Thermomicrobiales bacterium]